MEHVLAAIQSALNLKARQGWIFFLTGAVVLSLKFIEFPIVRNLDPTWVGICAIVCILGAVILLVSFGSHLFIKAVETKAARSLVEKQNREHQELLAGAVANLDVLTETEQKSLLWIFRKGQQRFRADIRLRQNTGLCQKGIVLKGDRHSEDIFQINDAVWALRDDWLEKYKRYHLSDKAPWDYSMF